MTIDEALEAIDDEISRVTDRRNMTIDQYDEFLDALLDNVRTRIAARFEEQRSELLRGMQSEPEAR